MRPILNPSLNKTFLALKLVFLLLLVFASFAVLVVPLVTGAKWVWVRGPSVDIRFGLFAPGVPAQVASGDYVILVWNAEDPNHIEKLQPGMQLVKRVACAPGQRLVVTSKRALCGGILVGLVRDKALSGMPIQPAKYDGVIPPGQLFLIGEHVASYDSRYFGLVSVQALAGKLIFHV